MHPPDRTRREIPGCRELFAEPEYTAGRTHRDVSPQAVLFQRREERPMGRIQAADPAAQSHPAAAEEKIRLEGPETVPAQLHRRTEHPVGREPADPAGAVPLLRNRIAALDRKAVIVGCGPGNPPPIPTG